MAIYHENLSFIIDTIDPIDTMFFIVYYYEKLSPSGMLIFCLFLL